MLSMSSAAQGELQNDVTIILFRSGMPPEMDEKKLDTSCLSDNSTRFDNNHKTLEDMLSLLSVASVRGEQSSVVGTEVALVSRTRETIKLHIEYHSW